MEESGNPRTSAILEGLCDRERYGQLEVGLQSVVATLRVSGMDRTDGVDRRCWLHAILAHLFHTLQHNRELWGKGEGGGREGGGGREREGGRGKREGGGREEERGRDRQRGRGGGRRYSG